MKPDLYNSDYYFLHNGGEAARIIQSIDWGAHILGTPEKWPENLKNTLSTLLSCKFPMFLWWGEELTQFYNDSYFGIMGTAKHPHAMGGKAADYWHECWDFIQPLIARVLDQGESVWYDDLLMPIERDGILKDCYWTFSYSPVRDDSRQIKGVLVIATETTEKVLHRQKINQSKEELEFAINAAEFGTFDLDPKTQRFAANPRLKDWFGLQSQDEVLLVHALESIAAYDRERVADSINRTLDYSSGGRYDIEYDIIDSKSKDIRTVHALGKAWFDKDNIAYRFNGTVQDITAQKKAAEELYKSRQLTDIAIKSMGLGIFNVDYSQGTIDYTAELTRLMTGKVQAELTIDQLSKYIHPEDLELRVQALKEGIKSGTFHYTPRVIWEDGSIHRIAISASRMFDSHRNGSAFSGTVADITEQDNSRLALLQAEEQLQISKREADALFRNVTDSSPTGLWLSDKDGRMTYFNKTLIEFTGMPYQELLKGNWTYAIAPEDYHRAKDAYLDAIASKRHFDTLFRARKHTGETMWCRAAGDPFYDAEGRYAGYAGFCMDIDEIISGRQAVTESQHKVTSMVEQSPVGICLFTGDDLKIEIANDIMIGYWGKDRNVIGKPFIDAVPELQGQPFIDILQEVYRTGETYYGRAMPADLQVDGKLSTYYFEFTYTPIRNSKGEIYGIMDIAVDVTQQVTASKKLEETTQALEGAIELAELATWGLSAADGSITCSDRFKEWLGLADNHGSSGIFMERIEDPYREKVMEAFKEAFTADAEDSYDYEFPITNKVTGQKRIIHANAQVLYSKDGTPEGISGTAQDVTKERELQHELQFKVSERTSELNAANAELEARNRELSQFAYIASHDLQEPVRKISVFADMLQNNLHKNPEKADLYLGKITGSAKRMENLIKDVLQFSRLSQAEKNFEPVDLNTVILETLADFDLVIEQKNAVIQSDVLPEIEAIPLQMAQLFGNLMSNALKYSRPDIPPLISIRLKPLSESDKNSLSEGPDQDYLKIEISDNGIGFSQQHSEQIFNIFQRLHGNGQFAGMGIGLAMCRKILQNHGGTISAVSEEGLGSTFAMILPKSQAKKGED
ncbi:PAS domain-containing sensor histidine kinase [Flavobacterium ustbae]|uniref:PAS domain-containing sensor histidine kinase n=1 Tax=Flavobacterium ustbae TaxID=2488790 RepID=UPI000F7893AB|nr:PAS domain S-box protein [Flavobacterium ustbae]